MNTLENGTIAIGAPGSIARELAEAQDTIKGLLEALVALSRLEINNHSILDRLQFSDSGRALSKKIQEAITKAKGAL